MKKILIIALLFLSCKDSHVYEKRIHENSFYIITFEKALKLLEEYPEILLLDIRTKEEYNFIHLKGAINIDFDEDWPQYLKNVAFRKFIKNVKNKETIMLIYSFKGDNSRYWCEYLSKRGYTKVYDMGAMITWPIRLTDGLIIQ